MAFATYTVLSFGMLVSVGTMLYAGEPGKLTWWPLFMPFCVWVLLPYTIVWRESGKRSRASTISLVLLSVAAALTAFSVFVLYDAFFVNLDPHSGIVLIFIPVYQLIGLVPVFMVVRYLARRGAGQGGPGTW